MTAKDIVLAVIIPLALAEVGPWCGWLAAKLLPWAAKLRYGDTERAAVRLEEWSDDLDDIPGQLTKLAYAVGQLAAGSAVSARRKTKGVLRKTEIRDLTSPTDLPVAERGSLVRSSVQFDVPPNWQQLADILRQGISAGEWRGCPLPSIKQLRQEYNVGRDTVIRATELLKDEGLVFTVPSRGVYARTD
jgi:GntR family transcriptional regulator